jgi:hypothetical protein
MKSVSWAKPGYASITCSTISNIPYNLIFTTKFNDSSILITIISFDYLNLPLADEHVGDITIPTQVIEYNQNFSRRISQSDWNIQIKLNYSLSNILSILTNILYQIYCPFLQTFFYKYLFNFYKPSLSNILSIFTNALYQISCPF